MRRARIALPARPRRDVPFGVPALPLLAVGLLVSAGAIAGCGGGSSTTTTTASVPSSPAASTQATTAADSVADVAGVPISKASYEHWTGIESKLGASGNAGHRALGFLLTSQWVLGEAKARGQLSVSEAEVKQRFAQLAHQSFPKAGASAEILLHLRTRPKPTCWRVSRSNCWPRASPRRSPPARAPPQHSAILPRSRAFQTHWKALTSCKSGYVMEYCKEYNGKPRKPHRHALKQRVLGLQRLFFFSSPSSVLPPARPAPPSRARPTRAGDSAPPARRDGDLEPRV